MKGYGLKWIALVFMVLTLSVFLDGTQQYASAQKVTTLRMGENKATLDPNSFSDPKVRSAYQVAKEIPQVLDSIYCYCRCEESPAFRHKSLLSCYVERHASM